MKSAAWVGIGLLASGIATGTVEAATSGACSPTAGRYVVAQTIATVTGLNFVNIPETALSFTQAGAKASCVKVSFTATVSGNGAVTQRIRVRAILDADTLAISPIGYFDNTVAGAQSYVFIFPAVSPGAHRIGLQFATNFVSATGTLFDRTMIVEYAK